MLHSRLLPGLLLAGTSLATAAVPSLKLQEAATSALHAGPPALMLEIGGRPVAVRREYSRALATGDVAWSGSWDAAGQAAGGERSLVRSPEGITAVVHRGQDLLRIVPVGGGRHQILPLATGQLPMHPPGDIPVGPLRPSPLGPAGSAPNPRSANTVGMPVTSTNRRNVSTASASAIPPPA